MLANAEDHLQTLSNRITEIESKTQSVDREILFSTVGRALTAWSKMEEYLVIMASQMLRVPVEKAGLLMYSILNFGVWLSILHELCDMDETLHPFKKRLGKITERLRRIKDRRDQLAHHSVEMKLKIDSVIRPSRFDTRQKSLRQIPMNMQEVVDFTETVLAIADDLAELSDAINAALAASTQKSA